MQLWPAIIASPSSTRRTLMDALIIVCLSSGNHYEWLREGARRPAWWQQPELRAPFLCEEALLARGSFSLMQHRGRRTGVPGVPGVLEQ
jgi:hypothetical protein